MLATTTSHDPGSTGPGAAPVARGHRAPVGDAVAAALARGGRQRRGVDVDADGARRPEAPGRRRRAPRCRSPRRAPARPPARRSASAARASRVDGWAPLPKARPGIDHHLDGTSPGRSGRPRRPTAAGRPAGRPDTGRACGAARRRVRRRGRRRRSRRATGRPTAASSAAPGSRAGDEHDDRPGRRGRRPGALLDRGRARAATARRPPARPRPPARSRGPWRRRAHGPGAVAAPPRRHAVTPRRARVSR